LKRIFVRFAWNNISIAELRDLNRHRTGHRFSPLIPIGFYTPEEVAHPGQQKLLERHKTLIEKLAADAPGSHYYGYLLGAQTVYEHSTHADKFLYEAELRTGMGTHFRYAEHLRAVYREFIKQVPQSLPFQGEARPDFREVGALANVAPSRNAVAHNGLTSLPIRRSEISRRGSLAMPIRSYFARLLSSVDSRVKVGCN
jgi:hypothetical protein